MNTYEKAISLGLTGTDQEILDQMNALTEYDINRNVLITWLTDGGYWEETPGGMIGDLTAAYDVSTGVLRKKFDSVWRWLYKRDDLEALKTSKLIHADDMLSIINKISTMSGALRNKYFALGGGAPYRSTTLLEFDAQRTAALASQAFDNALATAQNDYINPAEASRDIPTLAAAYTAAAAYLNGL